MVTEFCYIEVVWHQFYYASMKGLCEEENIKPRFLSKQEGTPNLKGEATRIL